MRKSIIILLGIILLCTLIYANNPIPTDSTDYYNYFGYNLYDYYRCDNASQSLIDRGVHKKNATTAGGANYPTMLHTTYDAGLNYSAYVNTTTFFSIPNSDSIGNNWSIGGWFKFNRSGSEQYFIYLDASNFARWNGIQQIQLDVAGSYDAQTTNTDYSDGWNHFIFSCNKNTAKFCINSTANCWTFAVGAGCTLPNSAIKIGGGNGVAAMFIDELFVINRSLSNAEMDTLYTGTFESKSIDNCSSYSTIALNITLMNITDSSRITTNVEYYFNYSEGGTNFNYSNSFIDDSFGICINPPSFSFLAEYQIDFMYKDITYSYQDSIILDGSTKNLFLYATDDNSLITMSVTDTYGNELSDVNIKVQKWDLGNNTFKTVSTSTTNIDGESLAYLNLYDTWYKFILTYNGIVMLDTQPAKLSSALINFVLNLEQDYYSNTVIAEKIYATITFDNTSKYFTYTWDEQSADIDSACLTIEKHTLNAITKVNSSCTASGSGSIILAISNSPGNNTYIATGYVTIDGLNKIAAILSVDFNIGYKKYGIEGVWLSFLLMLALALIGIWSPAAAIIMMLFGFAFTNIMGMFHLNIEWIVALIVLGIITIIRVNRR